MEYMAYSTMETHCRQWMFNYDENICSWFDSTGKPGKCFSLVITAMVYISPKTIHACPYFGEEGTTSII